MGDYSVQTMITPHLVKAFGLAARVQGQERYYVLLLSDSNLIKLVKRLDGEIVLAEQPFPWKFGKPYRLRRDIDGRQIQAWLDGILLFSVVDPACSLSCVDIELVCGEGQFGIDAVTVVPNSSVLLFERAIARRKVTSNTLS